MAQSLVALSEASAVGRKAVLEALVAQLDDAVSGLSEREAATPRLRFADTAARCALPPRPLRVTAVDGGGSSGRALFLVARLCRQLRRWVRSEPLGFGFSCGSRSVRRSGRVPLATTV